MALRSYSISALKSNVLNSLLSRPSLRSSSRTPARLSEPKHVSAGKEFDVFMKLRLDAPAIECLDYLLTHKKLGSIGAAMIIEAVGSGRPTTLRDIAVMQVNKAWNKGITSTPRSSEASRTTVNLFVRLRPVRRSTTFHASPLYNALREGLKYLVKNGLAETRQKRPGALTTRSLPITRNSFVELSTKSTSVAKEGA